MGIDTPNLLSRETTFLMAILKKCLMVEKTPNEPNNQISLTSVSDHPLPSTEGVFGHSVPPRENNPLPSTEGAFGHSVPSMEVDDPLPSTEGVVSHSLTPMEGVFDHSIPLTEENPLTSTENRSQMNRASILDTADSLELILNSVSGLNNHSLSITDLPLTQEKVESTYADVFQGLGKFPGEPYKLRFKPDAVPAKHRPRKVPVHLQDAFHEELGDW